MRTKDIRTSAVGMDLSCDVCGRTLLRGERAHPYLERGDQRTVCELCTARAEQEGWLREGEMPAYDDSAGQRDRRGSLFGRLRRRRDAVASVATEPPPDLQPVAPVYEPRVRAPEPSAPVAEPLPRPVPEPRAPAPSAERPRRRVRETRGVRAIPTNAENRIAFAIDAFNTSEHPRTVAGVARSLGLPQVSVRPLPDHPSVVRVVVGWELCWYRYEFDLADEDAGVRLAAQGQELEELPRIEREPNAVSDHRGLLSAA
jgi:hypothetical protein